MTAQLETRPAKASGALGRLGAWTVRRRRAVTLAWCAAVVVLGAFAPFADHALSGAGWEAPGSESIAARRVLDSDFGGRGSYALPVVVAARGPGSVHERAARQLTRVRELLAGDP